MTVTGPTGAAGVTGAPGMTVTGPTGATGVFNQTDTVFHVVSGAAGPRVPILPGHSVSFTTNTPDAVKLSVATGPSGAVVSIDSPGAGGTGATGLNWQPVIGTFVGFTNGSYGGPLGTPGHPDHGIILPVTKAEPATTTPGAFTLNDDGSVTANQPGLYLVTSKIQIEPSGNAQGFALQVDGQGSAPKTYYNSTSITQNTAVSNMTSIIPLAAGQRISNGFLSGGPITLTTNPGNIQEVSPSSTLTLLRVGDLPPGVVGG